ncbi:MAG: methyltransferase domain-containing protein [Bacteroidota bacterium]
MQTYQWNAVDYAKSSSVQQQWARELIRKLNLKGNETLLDIGSGDGKVTAEIASLIPNGSVMGIDSSEEMIVLAQRMYPRDTFINLQFQREDANSLPFENEFDVVFSNATLHWIFDHRPVLRGIFTSLKQGGKILLQMGGKGGAAEVITLLEKQIAAREWCEYFQDYHFPYAFYGPSEYQEWLRESGLKEIRAELIEKDMAHPGRAGFELWIRTTWLPYTQRVPETKRNMFISELADAYLDQHVIDEAGKVHVHIMRLEIEALKP